MRDQRDPEELGVHLLVLRKAMPNAPLAKVYDTFNPSMSRTHDYDGSGPMSNDPAEHHSKTPQDSPLESDGGA